MKNQFETRTKQETWEIAERLGKLIHRPVVILLYGDLGAGKTTFTQGLAKGLEITQTVTSPTFTMLKIYKGRHPMYHIDAYRLEGVSQDLGFEEYLMESDGVTVVEWPMYIQDVLPKTFLTIKISIGDQDQRIFEVESVGENEEKLQREWLGE